MSALRVVIVSLMCCALVACGVFPESSFMLSNESRLPKWFHLTSGLSRSEVIVEMSYLSSPVYGRTAAFILRRQDGTEISRLSGRCRGDQPIYLGPPATDTLRRYPTYEVITVNGSSEVIEHRAMEPIFYISDDPTVLARFALAAAGTPASRQ
jgi:hypothetical protein